VVVREAHDQAKPLRAHYAHLAVHGALHLRGYDHERKRHAVRMAAEEKRILAALGFPDPYGGVRDRSCGVRGR
jgi:probable rRNA maturation factor